jgi:hypothetical protein
MRSNDMRRVTWSISIACFLAWASASAQIEPVPAGKIVVANDEWTLSNAGFEAESDASVFATNIASWFAGGGPGSFLVYTNNFGLTQDSLAAVMTRAGHAWTISTSIPFDYATLRNYDGVFLGGFPVDNHTLIDYVWDGGNVYICGGTDVLDEAAVYNDFLHRFNFAFDSQNGVAGHTPISNDHRVFSGVHDLFQQDGTSVRLLYPGGRAFVLVSQDAQGLYALYDPQLATGTNETRPAAFWLAAAPNPFVSSTTIHFGSPVAGYVQLDVVDVAGRQIARLVEAWLPAGVHHVRWNARTRRVLVAAGTYFYRLETPTFMATGRVVFVGDRR